MSAQLEERIPQLARGVRFRKTSEGRGVLLVPEGIIKLNATAAAIVELVDGTRSVREIAASLAQRYTADESAILADVEQLLNELVARTRVELAPQVT